MPKKGALPKSSLEGEPWPLNLEQELAIFLLMSAERFQEDSSNPLPAFEALTYIASYFWQTERPSPPYVPVPWWVIEVLAAGFNIYRDSAESAAPLTLGEAYSLEGRGQGKEPRIQRALRELRDMRIAAAIALADAEDVKIEAALQEQADKTRLSVGQIRRIWEKNRKRATSAVTNFRTRMTS